MKDLFGRRGSGGAAEARENLTLELAEIDEIAGKLFKRIDDRLAALKQIEARLDARARELDALVARAASIGAAQVDAVAARRQGVLELARKGLKVDDIAGIFDMTRGEVELILNLGGK